MGDNNYGIFGVWDNNDCMLDVEKKKAVWQMGDNNDGIFGVWDDNDSMLDVENKKGCMTNGRQQWWYFWGVRKQWLYVRCGKQEGLYGKWETTMMVLLGCEKTMTVC